MDGLGKRRTDACRADLDASLDELVSRLGATSTEDHDKLIAVLVDVLKVDESSAGFFLEATNWNAQAAVQMFYAEAVGPQPVHPYFSVATGAPQEFQEQRRRFQSDEYESTPVIIADLPEGWSARVTRAGTISFTHNESGHEQSVVPPGFGRLVTDKTTESPLCAASSVPDTCMHVEDTSLELGTSA